MSAFDHDPNDPRFFRPEDVSGAQLFPNRFDMVTHYGNLTRGSICEVGVAFGKLSTHILRTVAPRAYTAIDVFRMHLGDRPFWGKTPAEWFGPQTHRDLYENRLGEYPHTDCTVLEGLSHEMLASLPAGMFDVVYLDADHRAQAVARDVPECVRVLKCGGVLILNDYICHDHIAGTRYGVVEGANELVKAGEFKIVGFALHPEMFCDIALRRR
jgi:SAM-dependent methyltransferase